MESRWFGNTKLGGKFAWCFAAVLSLNVALGVFCLHKIGLLHPTDSDLAQSQSANLRALTDLRLAVDAHRRSQFEYMVAHDEAERRTAENHLREAYKGIQTAQESYSATVAQPEETRSRSQLHGDLDHYLAVSQPVMNLIRIDSVRTGTGRGGRSHARRRKVLRKKRAKSEALAADLLFGPGESSLTKVLSAIRSLEARNLRSAEEAKRAGTSAQASVYASALRQTTLFTGVTLGLGLVVALSTGLMVIRPIHHALAAARRIASGDLSEDVEALDYEDEAGEFARCVNNVQGSLRSMIESSIDCSRRIAAASETISVATRQQTQSAGVQHEQTELVVTSVREIAATSKDISEQSGRATAFTRQFTETAGKGGAAVEAMSVQISSIADILGQTSKRIGESGKSSERIAQIAAVIDNLAGQSNSLLLNASIEAAGASDKGRGFVRAAHEVTELGERTTRAAKEIGIMLAQIQIGSRNALSALGEASRQSEDNAEAARTAEELIHTTILGSESLSETLTLIATAAERQMNAINQIVPSLDQISKVTFESSACAQRSAAAAEQLADAVEELQTFATFFPARDEAANRERDLPAWSSEPARGFPAETFDHNRGRGINGLSVAARPSVNPVSISPVSVNPVSVNPGRARIHARLVTPETNPESQPRAPSAAS